MSTAPNHPTRSQRSALTARRWSRAAAGFACSLALAACASPEGAEDVVGDVADDAAEAFASHTSAAVVADEDPGEDCVIVGGLCVPPTDRPYEHPLQNLERLPDGSLPYFDTKRSPSGAAYAIGESVNALSETAGETGFSGVVELGVRTMTATERSEKPAREVPAPHEVIDAPLRAALDSADAGELLPVQIHLPRTRTGTVTQRVNRAIAEGAVDTFSDREAVRQSEMDALAAEVATATRPLADAVRRAGGEVIYRCVYAPCLTAKLTATQTLELSRRSDIQRMGILEDSTADSLNGQEKAEVYQTRLFWDQTFQDGGYTYQFDGNNGNTTDIRVAVLDDEGFRTSHVAFKEGTSGSRIHRMYDCRTPPCVQVNSYSGISDHGTAVLGTVLGDYRDGQDPAVATADAREQRSASGGEAKAYLYWAQRQQGDQQAVYDSVVAQSPAPHMLVSSNSVGTPSDCAGEDSLAVGADGVYEAGVAYFKSANQGNGGSTSDCTVGRPGDAIGVFTVNGYDDTNGSVCDSKSAPIRSNTNWGGATSAYAEGKYRSIIDLTGSYQGAGVPWFTSDTAVGTFVGTSHSTPSVASAAVNLIDQMKNYRNSNFIDDPGVLYAWMLNMGDRRDQNGDQMATRYDHRTGAGNIKMRFLGGPGMDAPYYLYHYEMCVDDGEVYTIPINNSQVLSADVDSLRAVAWWYDRRIESAVQIDDIDLQLRGTGGTLIRGSMDSYDNKERIYYNDLGGKAVKLEVRGYDVSSDSEGCGSNSMRVFVTIMIEDDDRDDFDGPSYDPATCEGVENL